MSQPEVDSKFHAKRYVRWQTQAIGQLSFANNLFCGFSVAALGFAVSLLREASFTPTRLYAVIFLLSLAFLSFSVLCGVTTIVTRLFDFRYTAHKIRLAQKRASAEEIEAVGDETKKLGKATWCLFKLSLASFLLGVACLVVSVFGVYGSRLLHAAGL